MALYPGYMGTRKLLCLKGEALGVTWPFCCRVQWSFRWREFGNLSWSLKGVLSFSQCSTYNWNVNFRLLELQARAEEKKKKILVTSQNSPINAWSHLCCSLSWCGCTQTPLFFYRLRGSLCVMSWLCPVVLHNSVQTDGKQNVIRSLGF